MPDVDKKKVQIKMAIREAEWQLEQRHQLTPREIKDRKAEINELLDKLGGLE